MTRKPIHHPAVIISLFLIPLILVVVVWILTRPPLIVQPLLPELNFRESTAPAIIHTSVEDVVDEVEDGLNMPAEPDTTRVHLSFQVDGTIMLATVYSCVIFESDGTETARYELESIPHEMFVEAGIDPAQGRRWTHPAFLNTIHGRQNGEVWAIFQEVYFLVNEDNTDYQITKKYLPILVIWDKNGQLRSLINLGPEFFPYLYTAPNYGFDWSIQSYEDTVMILTRGGVFQLFSPNTRSEIIIFEQLTNLSNNWCLALRADYAICPNIRYNLDGSIDWEWLKNITNIRQDTLPQNNQPWDNRDSLGFLMSSIDGKDYIVTGYGLCRLSASGLIEEIVAQREALRALNIESDKFFSDWVPNNVFNVMSELADGWILLPNYPQTITNWTNKDIPGAIRTDSNFNPIEIIELVPEHDIRLTEDEIAGASESDEPTGPQLPLYEVGDTIDPQYIRYDLHPVPGGFEYIDHTNRRLITFDENLHAIDVIDRSIEIPNGLWQNINAHRMDSRGYHYLHDFQDSLIQVLDPDLNYVRRHYRIGEQLFGNGIYIVDIAVDSLDRLWLLGPERIVVLDKAGNLLRIFESLSLSRQRSTNAMDTPTIPPEVLPEGYTILPTASGLPGGYDPTEPIEINITGIDKFFMAGGSLPDGYFYIQDNNTGEIVLFDWNGREQGVIDIENYTPSDTSRLTVGVDGLIYHIDPETDLITVYDPYGVKLNTIEIAGLPCSLWQPMSVIYTDVYGEIYNPLTLMDENHRIIMVSYDPIEFRIFPLLADDPLEPLPPEEYTVEEEVVEEIGEEVVDVVLGVIE